MYTECYIKNLVLQKTGRNVREIRPYSHTQNIGYQHANKEILPPVANAFYFGDLTLQRSGSAMVGVGAVWLANIQNETSEAEISAAMHPFYLDQALLSNVKGAGSLSNLDLYFAGVFSFTGYIVFYE